MSTPLRLLSVLCLAWSAVPIAAQCTPSWSSAAPRTDVTGTGWCSTLWDPDGSGPLPQRLVIGGEGLIGGSAPAAQRVMTWDGAEWQPLGSGPGTTGRVHALTVWNGLLVAAGTFTGGGLDRIALWNGSAWQALGTGLADAPAEIAVWNGYLVAAAIHLSSALIRLWNGTAWSSLPTPPQLRSPMTMVQFQGLLCIGGIGSPNGVLERWNGTSWLPSIQADNWITCLGVRSFQLNSSLYVGGHFSSIGGVTASRVASTSGGSTFQWIAAGNGLPSMPVALHVRATSAIGAAVVVATSSPSAQVVQLSGSSFVAMGNAPLSSLTYYGGSYHGAASGSTFACRRYDGSAWVPVTGQSIAGEVRALTQSGPDMIVGGTIQATAGAQLNRIARWNGTAFQPLGTGIGGTSVDALTTLGNGDVVAGGLFASAGGTGANNVARWNGTSWSALGTGCDQQVFALCRMPNGDVIAGGRFATAGGVPCARIARWNGTAWTPLGSGMNGDVLALAVRSDGTLFAGGAFSIAGGVGCSRIAQWNGTAWAPLGTGCTGDVHALTVRPNDNVVAVGAFLAAGGLLVERCARWTGTTWLAMGAGSGDATNPRAVLALPNGEVVAGRGFHQPILGPDSGISRWNGNTWSGLGTGLAAAAGSVTVRALAQRADGALIVGGDFGTAGGLIALGLARLQPTCPALATPYGTGCATAAGPLALTAETLPWLGSVLRTATTGLAPGSLCFGLTGFTQMSIPLQSLVLQGQPGCTLLASADSVMLLLPDSSGAARGTLALPLIPSLNGAVFYQQSILLELNGLGALTAVRGSNALALTIGTL